MADDSTASQDGTTRTQQNEVARFDPATTTTQDPVNDDRNNQQDSKDTGAHPDDGQDEDAELPVQEEDSALYRKGGLHPVYIGDTYHDRYQIINKIGYGVYSTVWLAKDLKAEADPSVQYKALKILTADAYDPKHPIAEREIMKELREGNSKWNGYRYICHILDDFEHHGPNGTHVCLVFELMGEDLSSFGAWFAESEIPESIMRRFTIQLLCALIYAHAHNVIHTDIKPDNIYVKFIKHSLIESQYLLECPPPRQDKNESKYTVIRSQPLSRNYYSPEEGVYPDMFDIALGDWGVSSWVDNHLTYLIQPELLRSPEVLIGAPWDQSTDIWNLGGVVMEVFQAIRPFSGGKYPPDWKYNFKQHLAEIVFTFGPFPQSLLVKGETDLVSENFDNEGKVRNPPDLSRPNLNSEAFVPNLSQESRDNFSSFLTLAMTIDPANRPSPVDLLRHPWLGALPPKDS